MRITFVSPVPNFSGGIRVIAIYADGLRARGHEVTVVAPRPDMPGRGARLRALLRGRWLRTPATGSHFDRTGVPVHWIGHSGPVTDADVPDADVVIATWWETAFAVAALSPAKGRKVYFVQHHEVHDFVPRHLAAGSYHLPLRKITIAGWIADILRDAYKDPDVAIVPNSVDLELFSAPPRERGTPPTLGLMYATETFKGLDTSLEAIRILRRSLPDLRIVAFGTPAPGGILPLPPGTRYFRQPRQQELRDIYALCDVFLVGSRSEGFGLPILEAMACRCPVVATRTGCAPDVIKDGVNGFVGEIEDAAGLAARCLEVLRLEPSAWRAMSAAARHRVEGYTWEDATVLFERALMPIPEETSGS